MILEEPYDFSLAEVEYTDMLPEHIEAVRHMESLTFSEVWSVDSYKRELTCGYGRYFVALWRGEVVASCGGWLLYDELDVTNVIVSPYLRHKGIGTRLFYHFMRSVVDDGCDMANLEVRFDNEPAKTIYRRFGFKKIGVRKKYYDGIDDAWTMQVCDMQQPKYYERLDSIAAELEQQGE